MTTELGKLSPVNEICTAPCPYLLFVTGSPVQSLWQCNIFQACYVDFSIDPDGVHECTLCLQCAWAHPESNSNSTSLHLTASPAPDSHVTEACRYVSYKQDGLNQGLPSLASWLSGVCLGKLPCMSSALVPIAPLMAPASCKSTREHVHSEQLQKVSVSNIDGFGACVSLSDLAQLTGKAALAGSASSLLGSPLKKVMAPFISALTILMEMENSRHRDEGRYSDQATLAEYEGEMCWACQCSSVHNSCQWCLLFANKTRTYKLG